MQEEVYAACARHKVLTIPAGYVAERIGRPTASFLGPGAGWVGSVPERVNSELMATVNVRNSLIIHSCTARACTQHNTTTYRTTSLPHNTCLSLVPHSPRSNTARVATDQQSLCGGQQE